MRMQSWGIDNKSNAEAYEVTGPRGAGCSSQICGVSVVSWHDMLTKLDFRTVRKIAEMISSVCAGMTRA